MALTDEQINQYYETQGNSPNPLSPAEFESSLNTTALSPTPTDTFQTPSTPSPFPIQDLNFELTQPEQAADTLSDQIRELNNRLLGESSFTAQQQNVFGVGDLRTQQEDLVSQLEGFKLKSQALENEFNLASERVQQESLGRGRTAGGVAPLTAAAQRGIALRQADVASQALTTAATLSAVQGKLGTAQRQVEEAVAQKFGPLKEELAAKMANLEVIINSPSYTNAQKKRAVEQQQALNAQEREIARQEESYSAIISIGVEAARNKAPASVREQINALLKNPTAENVFKAQELAAPYLPQAGSFSFQDLSKNALTIRSAVRQEPAFKDFTDILNAYQNTKVGYDLDNAAGDLAMVNGIAKILDPGSVIRPAEFETVKEAQGFFEQVANFPYKVSGGRIAGAGARERFLRLAEQLVVEKAGPLKSNLDTSYGPVAQGLGLELGQVVPEVGQLDTLVSQIQQTTTEVEDLEFADEEKGVFGKIIDFFF